MLKSVLRSTLTEHFKRFAKLEHAFYYLSGPKGETTSGSNPFLGFHEQHDTTWIWHSHTIALANKVQRQIQDLYN